MRTSITFSGFARLFGGDLRAVLDAARLAEDVGVHQVVLPDHVVIGTGTDRYPWGRFPYPPEEPWPEPMVVLAGVAAVTDRIRLATGVLVAPLRPAALLAKQAATLDRISDGRLDLGVGSGWQREEHAAVGVDYDERVRRLDDTIRACAALWTAPPPVSFRSPTVSFTDVWCEPRPVQTGGVPVWFGGEATPATVRRVAELGAGWLPIKVADPSALRDGVERFRAAFTAAGRDPAELGVRAGVAHDGDWGATRARAEALVGAGATIVSLGLGRTVRDGADVAPFLRALGAALAS